jgi:hypothetical protein
MAVLFVSHSSKDDAVAGDLEAWLARQGFTDLFIDHRNIMGGDKWREELRASAAACRVVVSLVTESWLASDECFGEFIAAVYLGRRIIPLFLLAPDAKLGEAAAKRLTKVSAEDQGIKLEPCMTAEGKLDIDSVEDVAARLSAGLRAAGALNRIGLDPEAFAIDRKLRPTPFPGLESFGDADADAALFYGRSREIALALEELRKMRAGRDLRPFVILGASGSGKSSLLKAGIIPRLRRERPAWLPLRTFRPGADPLFNLASAFAQTLVDDYRKIEAAGVIRDRLMAALSAAERAGDGELTAAGRKALAQALESEGQNLRRAANLPSATILISIDQAEEIARAAGASADALGDYLRAILTAADTDWLVAFTVRSDSFPELQAHRRFQGLEAHSFDLRAMPTFRFDSVVEQPARRYGIEIDQGLTDALMKDIPNEDALPLLAFTLERLWRQFYQSGTLTKDNYDRLGGLKGLIEDAAERALGGFEPEQDQPLPSGEPPKRMVELGASTFVPRLAQINDQGAIIRRVAKLESFDEEQRELLARLGRWRLIVIKGDTNGNTVEVTHEALFREWTRLKAWLEPERARLNALRLLQLDALTWNRNDKDRAFLNHRGRRLMEANALAEAPDYRKHLDQTDVDYLAACRTAERGSLNRSRQVAAVFGLLVSILIAGPVAWWYGPFLRERAYWLMHVKPATPGERTFTDCTHCPEMVVLRAGKYKMGSLPRLGDNNEMPQHDVTFEKPFAIGKTEVTFDQWEACVHYGDCASDISTAGWGRRRQPVVNVSWQDAQRYVNWLSRVTGQIYRLPTEAEWEYAARSGRDTHYSFGPDEAILGDYGWFAGIA